MKTRSSPISYRRSMSRARLDYEETDNIVAASTATLHTLSAFTTCVIVNVYMLRAMQRQNAG